MTTTKKKAELFDVPVTVKVSRQFLADIIITAIEGGFGSSWFPVVRLIDKHGVELHLHEAMRKSKLVMEDVIVLKDKDHPDWVWNEFMAQNVAHGGSLTWFEDADESGIPEDYVPHRLDREKLLKGLGAVLTKYPHLASSMGTDDDGGEEYDLDAIGADAVIQLALLDEVRYG